MITRATTGESYQEATYSEVRNPSGTQTHHSKNTSPSTPTQEEDSTPRRIFTENEVDIYRKRAASRPPATPRLDRQRL